MNTRNTPRGARPSRIDVTAKILGIFLFIGGTLMLLSSFQLARQMFVELAQASHLWAHSPVNPGKEPAPMQIGVSIAAVALKVLVLFVMGYLSSLVASKGIQFYAAAASAPPRVSSVISNSPDHTTEQRESME